MAKSLSERLLKMHPVSGPGAADPFFERYGLLENPFPTSRKIIPEILYDQDDAVDKLVSSANRVLPGKPAGLALGIVGETGVGKTHFLRYAQHELGKFCMNHGIRLVCVEFQAGTCNALDLARRVLDETELVCRREEKTDLLPAIVQKLIESEKANELIDSVEVDEVGSMLHQLVSAFPGREVDETPMPANEYELKRDIAKRWLRAGAVTSAHISKIGAYAKISSASSAIRAMREVFSLACRLNIIHSFLVCLDEVETLFSSGLRRPSIQAFLQDLRYFYDEAVRGEKGYPLLMLSAATPWGVSKLGDINFPVYQRLGFEPGSRVELKSLSSFSEAQGFAYEYLEHAHQKWKAARKTSRPSQRNHQQLLSQGEMAQACGFDNQDRLFAAGGKVSQASALEALHRKVEEKRKKQGLD